MSGFRSRSGDSSRTPSGGSKQRRESGGSSSPRRRPERRDQRPRNHGGGGPAQRIDDPRLVAYRVLHAVSAEGAYGNLELSRQLRKARLGQQDSAFATELTLGSLRNLGPLDAVISQAAGRPISRIDADLLDALRLGTYQLLHTRVQPHAAVDTTVELVRSQRGMGPTGFINAVLRTVARKDPEEWFATVDTETHPRWIREAFARALASQGAEDELGAALAADDERPIVHLAATPGEISAEELALVTGGEPGQLSPYAVHLTEGGDPARLEPVVEGMARVQDEGSQLIAVALASIALETSQHTAKEADEADEVDKEAAGELWVDLCAGPGGKTALLAHHLVGTGGQLVAVEPTPHRARLVTQALEGTLAASLVTVREEDGRTVHLDRPADRILVDAPCTGLGALRRRPEARWRKQPSDVPALVQLQKELLRAAVERVRPGGIVVYSTCSPYPKETTDIVADVLSHPPGSVSLEALDTPALTPGLGPTDTSAAVDLPGGGRAVQLWPHRHGTDAMFFAALRRTDHPHRP